MHDTPLSITLWIWCVFVCTCHASHSMIHAHLCLLENTTLSTLHTAVWPSAARSPHHHTAITRWPSICGVYRLLATRSRSHPHRAMHVNPKGVAVFTASVLHATRTRRRGSFRRTCALRKAPVVTILMHSDCYLVCVFAQVWYCSV